MPTRNEVFPSKWLKAIDVEPPVVATVEACRWEVIGQGVKAERKAVLYFRGAVKPCPLNQTNWDTMVNLAGDENSDEWNDTVIELFAVDVVGPNGPTRGVRIRTPKPKPAKKKPAPLKDDIDTAMPTIEEEAF